MTHGIRRIVWICLIAVWVVQAGCAGARIEPYTRLPKDVTIDGIDVSRMTVTEACAALDAHHGERIGRTVFTLALPAAQVELRADAIGVTAETRAAVERAAVLRRGDTQRSLACDWSIPEAERKAIAERIARQNSVAPVNAAVKTDFSAREPFVFVPALDGVSIAADHVEAALLQAVSSKASCAVAVQYDPLPAEVTLSDVQAERRLIAQYTTSYAEYPYNKSNRVFNIRKAAACVNGAVLAPGETFDCNRVLGDRTEENGWRTATGIRDATYVSEYGGGVCQVSSTLFNAALMADLPITERHPHSWPMGYVDIGRDATISTGGKNLRFANSTGSDLYFSAWTDDEADTVTVSIYGAPAADGRTVSISSELVRRLPDEGMEVQLDESLPAGTRVVQREARTGCVSRTYKSYHDADGALLSRTLAYEDTYRSIRGLTYVSADIYYS